MRKLLPLVVVAVGATAFLAWNMIDREATGANGSPMSYAPADTPFAMGLVEPFPDGLAQRWTDRIDPVVPVYAAQLRHAADALTDADDTPTALPRLLHALADELDGRSAREVLAAFGVDSDSRMAVYGLGLVPVLRWELADPDAFRALVARLEQKSGEALPVADADGQAYWRVGVPDAPIDAVAAIVGGHLVLTIAPADADTATLEALFGLRAPRPSLLDSDTLDALIDAYGYQRNFVGFFDTSRFLTALATEPTPLEQAFLQAFDTAKPQIDDACREEYQAIALAWPRASFGYTALDDERMQVRAVLEASPEIAADLMTLRAPMPAMGAIDTGTLFNAGFSLNLEAVPALVNKRAGSIASVPYRCEALAWLNTGAQQAQTGVSNPALYAAAPVFRGFHAIVEELELGPDMQPTTLSGALVIGSANPQSLVAMAAMAVPQVGTLGLTPDGSVKRVELPPLPNAPADLQVFASMTDTQLALGFGEGADARLPGYMRTDDAQQPLMVFGYSGRLYAMLGEIVGRTAEQLPDPAAREEMQRQATIMRDVYAAWIEHAEMRVEFTEHGIEVLQDVRTRD